MVTVDRVDSLPLLRGEDIIAVRQLVRSWCVELGFSLVDQTKLVTATSELARNAVVHGGGGEMILEALEGGGRRGLRLTFQDSGPGIADIEAALRDGYTTNRGLGLGLGGARRLVNDFSIESVVGEGTKVTITRWV